MALAFLGLKKLKPKPPHKPHVAKDTASSNTIFAGLYGLAEGEIAGLVDGGKSILLDDTPLINANGTPNFKNISWDFRVGTNDQSHIAGFPAVENEQSVGVELRHDKAWTKYINNTQLSAIRLRLNWNALRVQHENGDITGHKIEYAVDIQTDGGRFDEVLKTQIHDKTSQGYKRSHRIELPKANKGWTIRVRRLTANLDNEMVADTMTVDAITEIIDVKLRYPNTALLGLRYDAKIFSNIANIAVHLKGKIIAVPSNYNAQTRDYVGLWDGTFQQAYSDNPAWIFYDICTNRRYGLGERLSGMVDKWSLYQLAQYCDELVDDGKGGKEPRFTCNVYLQKQEDAYTVLQSLASIFRGMSYYNGEHIIVDADFPKDPVYTFSAANVIDGIFNYSGTRARDRHNIAQVAWDNPDNNYKTEYAFVRDEQAITRLGVRVLNINAFGCTSQGQAQRAGLWALKSEQLETRTVSFSTGLEGFVPQVGQVINIADNVFAGRAISGRIISISEDKRTLTLDREIVANAGDTLVINGSNGNEKQVIQSISGVNITVHTAFSDIAVDNIWAINSDDLRMMQFRILAISQNEATFDITALQYERQKYTAIDDGVISNISPISVLNPDPIASPNHVTITSHNRVVQTQTVTTLSISWEQVKGATAYIVEWRKDDGVWQSQTVSGQLLDVEGVYAGRYLARIRAVDAFGNESLATLSQLTAISGKHGRPPRLARLTVQGKLFGMDLAWTFNKGSEDTNFTEIQVSPDGRSNIATLGQFAYPTNSHTINGLQGNLTQYYRARIVDKLGNTSDWTAWVSGTTDAQADKVLDLLQGQISQSHLDQSLRTPIAKILPLEQRLGQQLGKINSLENAVNAVNSQLPTLNQQLANAVRNIDAERNRITSAIRDITALQTANNAKTQEIANLAQTVGSHTSSIRELGVTTGDLAQKYSQLKTVADKATSDITQIKQTQAGQATSIERMGARFDSLAVGGRNLLLNSKKLTPLWTKASIVDIKNGVLTLTGSGTLEVTTQKSDNIQALENGKVTISFTAKSNQNGRLHIRLRRYNENGQLSDIAQYITIDSREFKRYSLTLDYAKWDNQQHVNFEIATYEQAGFVCEVKLPKLEIGTIPTDWSPAPEDVQSDIDTAKTQVEANINTVRETLTNASIALGRRIDDVSAEFKQADNNIKASVQEETQARTNADAAIAQNVNALQSDYSSNKASVASQIKTLSDKDKSTASQISQLTANVATAQQAADTANTKADDGIRRANNAQNKADTADAKATQAKADIVAEQRARADSESSIARQMSALDSKFTNADNAIKASVAQAQQTATNAQQALATAQSQLNAKIDGISVGGRNLLRHTQRLDQLWRFASGGQGNSMTVSNDGMARLTGIGATWKHLGYDISRDVGLNWLKEGQTFTLSVFARKVSGSSHFLSIALRKGVTGGFKDDLVGKNFAVGGEWQRLVVTGTITPGDLQYLFVRFEFWDDGVYELKKPQLEYGNVATDWNPAIEDDNVWRILRTPTDLNTLIETGKYFLAANTTNNPITTAWSYLVVEKMSDDRITQTVWADNDNKNQYRRVKFGPVWLNWEKMATGSDIAQTNAAIQELKQAQATKDTATAQRIAALDAAYKLADTTLTARLAHEEQTRASANAALTQRVDSLQSTINGNKASIDAQLRTLSEKDKATAQQLSQFGASLGQKADAAALNSLTTKVSQVEGRINAEASKYSTLQTTVGQHTASIQMVMQSVDGLKSQWTMKVESGGVVAGIGLASENGKSRFAIRADVLDVVSPDGTKRPMFSVLTTPQTINGVLVQKGSYFDTAFIARGSINMLHIADSIQSDNYVQGRSGWRLFKNGTIEINSTFGDGTKIQLTSRGLVGFYANGRKAFELGHFL